MSRKEKYFVPLFRKKYIGKKGKVKKYLFFSSKSFRFLQKKRKFNFMNTLDRIKISLRILLKKLMFKFGSLSNLKQFIDLNPALHLKSLGLVKMLLLIFKLSLDVPKN